VKSRTGVDYVQKLFIFDTMKTFILIFIESNEWDKEVVYKAFVSRR